MVSFFFQAEDGIRGYDVTGVQTCALPILVPGSVVLLAGEPGVGKSTLLLQLAQYVAAKGKKVLYVSGEESPQQIKLRSDRLGFAGEGVLMLPETDLSAVIEMLDSVRPALAIVDSIQTLYSRSEERRVGKECRSRW